MVYIRPSISVLSPAAVKPLADSGHAPDQHSLAKDDQGNEFLVPPQVERRRHQQDRRQARDRRQLRKNALLETRAGRDRRKNSLSINVSI